MTDPNVAYPPPPPPPAPEAEPYASWGRRVAATLLDVLLLVPGYVVVIIGSTVANGAIVQHPDNTVTVTDGANLALGLALSGAAGLALFIFSIWNQIFRQGRRGASLGKQMMGILVISEETARPIGAALTFVRQIVHVLDSLSCYVGYLWPLWDPKKQTFADKIMKTAVLYLPDVRF